MSNVSRRSFVEVAVGSLISLPVLAGGLVLGPRAAHAEDAGDNALYGANIDSGQDGEAKYTIIDVVRPYEVAFIAIDVTKVVKDNLGKDSFERLTGKKVHVKVTSRYGEHRTAEGDTNNDGIANIDVKQLAENNEKKDVNKLDTYEFNATVQVSCEGYRSFETSLIRAEGGSGLMVPLYPADAKGAWPYRASFDEWDVLYTKNKFVQSPSLKDDHTIQIVAKNVASTAPVTVELLVEGEDKPRHSVQVTPKAGEAVATFTGHFLQTGDAAALPVGKTFKVVLHDGATTYAWALALEIVQSVVNEPTSKENVKLSPFNTEKTSKPGADIIWPGTAPLVGGGKLQFWTPDLPVSLYVNPFGYAQFSIKSPSWGYKNDQGVSPKNGWGKYPIKSVSDQWDRMVKTAKTMGEKTNALVSKPGGIQQLDLFRSFSLMANFQFVACAKWDTSKGLFQGEASGQILVAADFTITENFMAGPIPVLITFALNASFIAGLNLACYSAQKKQDENIVDAIMDFGRWQWDYVNSGFTMTFNITPSLSVGVGIRGIASISVKGSITLTLFFGVMSKQAQAKHPELPAPHFTAGWSATISLVLHLFLFTETFIIKDFKFSTFYDNWKGKDQGIAAQEDEAGAALAAMSAMDLANKMSIISDDMLKSTVDVRLNGQTKSSLGPQADAEPIDWEQCRQEVVVNMDDGTPMTYIVYDLNGGQSTDEATAAEASDQSQADATQTDAAQTDAAQTDAPAEEVAVSASEDPAVTNDEQAADSASDPANPVELPEAAETSDQEGGDTSQLVLPTDAGAISAADDQSAPAATADGPQDGLGSQEVLPLEASDAVAASATEVVAQPEAAAEVAADEEVLSTPDVADAEAETLAIESEAEQAAAVEAAEQPETVDESASGEAGEQHQEGTEESLEAQADQAQGAEEGIGATWLTAMADGGAVNPGVSSIGSDGGVRPSSDVKIFGNVFGDPRVKVITVENSQSILGNTVSVKATLAFRIGTVELPGGAVRTRLIMNVIDGTRRGLSRVIEIDTKDAGFDHANLYDYDFDLDVINTSSGASFLDLFKSSYDTIMVAMVSGARANGDSTKITNAATDLVFSCRTFTVLELLGFDEQGRQIEALSPILGFVAGKPKYDFSMKASMVTGSETNLVHSISSLQIVREGNDLGTAKWIISFLDRRGQTAEDIFSNEKGRSDVRLGIAIYDYGRKQFKPIKADDTHWKLGDIDDLSVFEHVLHPKLNNNYTLMLRGSQKAYYYLVELDVNAGTLKKATRCASYDSTVRLVFWPGQACFLTSYPSDPAELNKPAAERNMSLWRLHKATWGSGATPELQMTQVGPQNFSISTFALNPRGTFMFWPQAHESDVDRVFDAEGAVNTKDLSPSFHIMACRMRSGKFSDPFIVADLPHDTDALAVVGTDRGAAIEMLGTEFLKSDRMNSDGKAHLYYAANIWYTSVPGVRSVTAVGCEAVSPFVSPGERATFHVALRNDGNVFIKGCRLTLCVKKAEGNGFDRVESASADITFSKDTLQESNWNFKANGALAHVEPDYALAPGKTSVYAVDVTIPADWHGEKKILFVASGGVKADEGGLAGQDDEGVVEVEFSIEPGDYQVIQNRTAPDDDFEQRYMDTIDVMLADDEEEFSQAPVTVLTGNTGSSGGGNAQGNAGGTNPANPTAPRQPLPYTADGSVGSGLGAGLAAAGAAMLAYERRRARNQRDC